MIARQRADGGAAHGREKARHVFVINAEDAELGDEVLSGLRSLLMIQRVRLVDGSLSLEQHHASSIPPRARKLAKATCGHWGVESGPHWTIDMQLHEDTYAAHDRVAAENIALVRRAALSFVKYDTKVKHGVKL